MISSVHFHAMLPPPPRKTFPLKTFAHQPFSFMIHVHSHSSSLPFQNVQEQPSGTNQQTNQHLWDLALYSYSTNQYQYQYHYQPTTTTSIYTLLIYIIHYYILPTTRLRACPFLHLKEKKMKRCNVL